MASNHQDGPATGGMQGDCRVRTLRTPASGLRARLVARETFRTRSEYFAARRFTIRNAADVRAARCAAALRNLRSTLGVVCAFPRAAVVHGCDVDYGLAIPYSPFARLLGFAPLSGALFLALVGVTLLYAVSVELNKLWFYRTRAGGH